MLVTAATLLPICLMSGQLKLMQNAPKGCDSAGLSVSRKEEEGRNGGGEDPEEMVEGRIRRN